jgi:hypothetical protein
LPLIEFNGNFHEKTMSELKNLGLLWLNIHFY